MSLLEEVGIYTGAIELAEDKCQELIEGAKTMLQRFGNSDDFEEMNRYDLQAEVVQRLKDNIDVEDITNSIISATFQSAEEIFESCSFFKEMDMSLSTYVNCHDSHIHIVTESNEYFNISSEEDVVNAVNSAVSDRLHAAIQEYLQKETGGKLEYPLEYVQDDVYDERFDYPDIAEFLATNELSNEIKTMVKADAIEVKTNAEKAKETVERS